MELSIEALHRGRLKLRDMMLSRPGPEAALLVCWLVAGTIFIANKLDSDSKWLGSLNLEDRWLVPIGVISLVSGGVWAEGALSSFWSMKSMQLSIGTQKDLAGCDLRGLDLRGMAFPGRHMEEAILANCDLTFSDFKGAHLSDARLVHSRLYGANFDGADLKLVGLYRASAAKASFRGATMHRVKAAEATFGGADLTGANFSRAELRSANLRHAQLQGAIFDGADLTNAKLCKNAINIRSCAGATFDGLHAPPEVKAKIRELSRRPARDPLPVLEPEATRVSSVRPIGQRFVNQRIFRKAMIPIGLVAAATFGAVVLPDTTAVAGEEDIYEVANSSTRGSTSSGPPEPASHEVRPDAYLALTGDSSRWTVVATGIDGDYDDEFAVSAGTTHPLDLPGHSYLLEIFSPDDSSVSCTVFGSAVVADRATGEGTIQCLVRAATSSG